MLNRGDREVNRAFQCNVASDRMQVWGAPKPQPKAGCEVSGVRKVVQETETVKLTQ